MKIFHSILFIVLFSINSFSQNNYIIAGQIQNMMFTDFIPKNYNYPSIDLNHDGIIDLEFLYSNSQPGGIGGGFTEKTSVITSPDCYVSCVYRKPLSATLYNCDTSFHLVGSRFSTNDTMIDYNDSSWQSGTILLERYSLAANKTCVIRDETDSNLIPHYFFLKLINDNDTLLGYIHFRTGNGALYDYACQGNESYFVINHNESPPSNINIYPIPFRNYLNIKSSYKLDYELHDVTGKIILSGNSDFINTESLRAGTYLLFLKNERVSFCKKIVKI
jgi:hypothetical protein